MILLVAYGGGHVAMLAPIAAALAAAGRRFTFVALTTARPVLERMGLPCIGFKDLPGADDAQVRRWGAELASDLPAGGPVSAEETIAYLGLNFADLVSQHCEAEARERYAQSGRQAFLPVPTLLRTLESLSPRLVVATNSPRAERAAILAAGRLGVPSLCAVDLFALQEVQWIGQPGYATRVCVLNEGVRRMFIEHGRRPEEIVVTGNPAFDTLRSPASVQAGAALRAARGWNDGRITMLWASQIEPERHPFADRRGDPTLPRRVEARLRALVASDARLRLVVRYHPSERVEFDPARRVEFSPTSEPLAALLQAVDVVVVTASTVGLEAAIAGRPVVSVDASVFTDDTRYAELGVARGVSSVEQLDQAVRESAAGAGTVFSQGQSGRPATQEILRVMDSLLS